MSDDRDLRLPRQVREHLRAAVPRVWRSVLFFAPLYFLGKQLAMLSGAALWMPTEWRYAVQLLSFGIGATCFHLARLRNRADDPNEVARPAENDRRARRRWFRFKRERDQADRGANWRGLAWWGVAAVLFGAHTVLRHETLVEWQPDRETLYGLFEAPVDRTMDLGRSGSTPGSETRPDWMTEEGDMRPIRFDLVTSPFYLDTDAAVRAVERGDPVFAGRVLFPLSFPRTEKGAQLMRSLERRSDFLEFTHSPRSFAIDRIPGEIRDLLQGPERLGMGITVLVYYVLHLLIVASISIAFGFTFSIAEELVCG
ncbi:hypothetical protein [Engelhardtia mirabilis]|uniref:Uncharacterized protein n=1 Tax=Engelhardtia mirabilis TaxID=2528011 RepID=A0A518BEA1_9BACT|nr:hypothetical protein Pla133_03790 [Planctomycetes bacterium Pla133]QDU99640.1 hypothetical protein Pla86_03790 [Planctomycetes bacterium Pla86]